MLETVDFSLEPLSKDAYKARRDELMEQLVVLQQQARVQGVGLVVLFEGWNGAGKGSRISDLMYHLDARATSVYVTENLDVKAARSFAGGAHGVTGFYPVMQEFWKGLGQRGTISFFDRGWYTAAVQHMLYTEFGKLSLKSSKRKSQKAVAAAMAEARDERHIDVLRRYLTSASDFERQLADDGYLVVSTGGGGVPVIEEDGGYRGVPAVIDKDRSSAKLAADFKADMLVILTAVPKVAINFNTPDQQDLDVLTVAEAAQYIEEGQFASGSMLPKVEACIAYLQAYPEGKAIITSLENAAEAIEGESGTLIVA